MKDNFETNKQKIIDEFFKLLKNETEIVFTNKHNSKSRLSKNQHYFFLSIKKNQIEYIKDKDFYKNKMKYIADTDTLLYRNLPIDDDGKKYFFSTLFKILKEIKKNNLWEIKNKNTGVNNV